MRIIPVILILTAAPLPLPATVHQELSAGYIPDGDSSVVSITELSLDSGDGIIAVRWNPITGYRTATWGARSGSELPTMVLLGHYRAAFGSGLVLAPPGAYSPDPFSLTLRNAGSPPFSLSTSPDPANTFYGLALHQPASISGVAFRMSAFAARSTPRISIEAIEESQSMISLHTLQTGADGSAEGVGAEFLITGFCLGATPVSWFSITAARTSHYLRDAGKNIAIDPGPQHWNSLGLILGNRRECAFAEWIHPDSYLGGIPDYQYGLRLQRDRYRIRLLRRAIRTEAPAWGAPWGGRTPGDILTGEIRTDIHNSLETGITITQKRMRSPLEDSLHARTCSTHVRWSPVPKIECILAHHRAIRLDRQSTENGYDAELEWRSNNIELRGQLAEREEYRKASLRIDLRTRIGFFAMISHAHCTGNHPYYQQPETSAISAGYHAAAISMRLTGSAGWDEKRIRNYRIGTDCSADY